jgi:hypothetical protein
LTRCSQTQYQSFHHAVSQSEVSALLRVWWRCAM